MNREIPLRYVVLHHTGIEPAHFDLMVERGAEEMLATWRCANWPPLEGESFTAIGDHRREYLEYEGEVSGNRGRVNRVAAGNVDSIEDAGEHVIVTLSGGVRIVLPRLR